MFRSIYLHCWTLACRGYRKVACQTTSVTTTTILALILLASCAATEPAAYAQTNLRVGFSGTAKLGHWVPITLTVPVETPALKTATKLEIAMIDGDESPVVYAWPAKPSPRLDSPLPEKVLIRGSAVKISASKLAVLALATVASRKPWLAPKRPIVVFYSMENLSRRCPRERVARSGTSQRKCIECSPVQNNLSVQQNISFVNPILDRTFGFAERKDDNLR